MPPSDEVLVHARGLTKRFGEFTAVNAVDFDVRVGEAFGFLGPNGAGKTSTMRMIACASPVTDGELTRDRHGPAHAGSADQGAAGRRSAARQPRRRADRRARTWRCTRATSTSADVGGERPRRRAARLRPALRARQRPGGAALRRDEAPAHHRPRADQRAGADHPRRADHRPRSAGAPPALGAALPAQAARRDADHHHPLHGRGRAAVRPAGGDGQGGDRRPRDRRGS